MLGELTDERLLTGVAGIGMDMGLGALSAGENFFRLIAGIGVGVGLLLFLPADEDGLLRIAGFIMMMRGSFLLPAEQNRGDCEAGIGVGVGAFALGKAAGEHLAGGIAGIRMGVRAFTLGKGADERAFRIIAGGIMRMAGGFFYATGKVSDGGIAGIGMHMAGRFFSAAGKRALFTIAGVGMGMAVRLLQGAGKNTLLLIAGVGVGVASCLFQSADALLLLLIAGIGVLMGDSAFLYGADELLFADEFIALIRVGVLFKATEGLLRLRVRLQREQNACQAHDKSADTAKKHHTALCALL